MYIFKAIMNLGDLPMKQLLYLMIAKPTICGFVAS